MNEELKVGDLVQVHLHYGDYYGEITEIHPGSDVVDVQIVGAERPRMYLRGGISKVNKEEWEIALAQNYILECAGLESEFNKGLRKTITRLSSGL